MAPGIPCGTGAVMIESVRVIGAGRVGSAVIARLEERGILSRDDADVVLLCVADSAIADVAACLAPGQWPSGKPRSVQSPVLGSR